jgi:hypothetical protein
MIPSPFKSLVLGVGVALALASGVVWAAPGGEPGPNPRAPGIVKKPEIKKAPEIDAAAGASAIALLAGVVLLLRERSRQRDL